MVYTIIYTYAEILDIFHIGYDFFTYSSTIYNNLKYLKKINEKFVIYKKQIDSFLKNKIK